MANFCWIFRVYLFWFFSDDRRWQGVESTRVLGIGVLRSIRSYVVQHLSMLLDYLPWWPSHYSGESSFHFQTLMLAIFFFPLLSWNLFPYPSTSKKAVNLIFFFSKAALGNLDYRGKKVTLYLLEISLSKQSLFLRLVWCDIFFGCFTILVIVF